MGPLEFVTTDANGNLASDGGAFSANISATTAANSAAIAVNNQNTIDNVRAINFNTASINANTVGIGNNSAAIANNTARLNFNDERITEVREGLAAIASVPDLYLNVNETWTAAGGVSLYDDGAGGSETGFGGGVQFRSSTEDNWSVGAAGSVSGGAYSVRVQARIGG